MYATVRAFKTKLRLWETQMLQENFFFSCYYRTFDFSLKSIIFGCCLPVENVFPGNYSGNTVDRARKQLMKLILLL